MPLNRNSLTANHPWLTGSEFLLKDESLLPNNVEIPDLDDNEPELKRAVSMNVTIDAAPPLKDMTRFSSWKRIKRIMSCIYRLLRRCRTLHGEWIGYEVVPKLLLLEMNAGERFAVFLIQRGMYGKELRALSEGNTVPSTSSLQSLMSSGRYRTGVEARSFASKKFFDNVQNALSTSFL